MRLDAIDKTLIKQELNLREHMKRTDALETLISTLESEFRPVQRHVIMVDGVVKFLGLLAVVMSIVGGILKVFNII